MIHLKQNGILGLSTKKDASICGLVGRKRTIPNELFSTPQKRCASQILEISIIYAGAVLDTPTE